MDFLASLGKKIKEFEEQARLLAETERARTEQEARSASADRARSKRKNGRKGEAGRGRRQTLTSQEAFGSDACPGNMPPPLPSGGVGTPSAGGRLIDDLTGRLDEAFLLSEILGPPRCVRGWDD